MSSSIGLYRLAPVSSMAPKRKRASVSSAVTGSGVHDSAPPPALAVPPTGTALVSTPEEASALIRRSSTRKKKAVNYAEDRTQETDGQAKDAFDGPLTELEEDELVDEDPAPKKKRRSAAPTGAPGEGAEEGGAGCCSACVIC